MYTWLLFDADNTLFDFSKAEANSLQATFEIHGQTYDSSYLAIYKSINHQVWASFERGELSAQEVKYLRFEKFFQAIGIDTDVAHFGKTYTIQLGLCPDLLPGAESLLSAVAPYFNLGLITNGLKAVQRSRLALSTIHSYFNPIIISEEVGVKKPDPAIFEIAFAAMGQPAKAEVLMIGDSLPSDIQGGNTFGIPTCWYNPHQLSNKNNISFTHEITQLSEIMTLVGPLPER